MAGDMEEVCSEFFEEDERHGGERKRGVEAETGGSSGEA